ncbi:uncharacterized protein RAG0_02749 [Rhynchosporium agropyri]|uniref:Uncharacterized protein n=1 Tax=Rhynchosporium agropyri TaxID=914238 RepID=A0A1E1K2J7_9HELO|nr:uncharacterized protein RAG0_02749 [Rhynchosporium agropyri]
MSHPDLSGATNPQESRSQAKRRQKVPISDASDFSAASDSDCDADSESDSGYSSKGKLDSEAERYRKIRADFVVAGPNLANPCDETKGMMKREEQLWNLHCKKVRKGDPVIALKGATAEDFKTFLVWRKERKNSPKRYMDEGILADLRNWIPTLGLDDSEVDKSALYVEDLCVLQNGLWVRDQETFPHERLRVQESPINIFAGFFPPLTKGRRPAVRLILNLQHIKRSGGKKKPKKFTFRDDESIICCPVIFIMALAIADNAFKNVFTSLRQIYDLVVPNGTDQALTPEERRHAMGNTIYLGTTRREDLIRAVGRLERHDDAPDKLNNGYVLQIKAEGYSTIKAAKNTFWYKKHQKAQRKINCRKTQLKNELLNRAINDFHETVHVDEVDRQMRGILPDNEVLTPSTIEYELEERATVAKLLFQPLDELHEDEVFDIRVQLVHALAQLCHRQETPRQLKAVQPKRHPKTRYSYASTSTEDDDGILQEQGGGKLAGVQEAQTLDNKLEDALF